MNREIYFGYIVGIFALVFIGARVQAQQQIGSYLHYVQHPDQINQAYTLSADQGKIYSVGRKQWMNMEGAPTTVLMGGHVKTKNERSSVGLNVLYDKIGPERYTEVNAFYGHAIRLSENDYLSGAINLGMRLYNVRFARLEESDPSLRQDIDEKVGTVGLSFMYYRPEQFYVGLSLPRIGGEQFKQVAVFRENYAAIAAYLFEVDPGFHVKTSAWLARMDNNKLLGNFSATAFLNRKFGIGANYATTKDLGFLASFTVSNALRVGYGYQFGMASTSIGGMRNGSHEISISYHFAKNGIRLL